MLLYIIPTLVIQLLGWIDQASIRIDLLVVKHEILVFERIDDILSTLER